MSDHWPTADQFRRHHSRRSRIRFHDATRTEGARRFHAWEPEVGDRVASLMIAKGDTIESADGRVLYVSNL